MHLPFHLHSGREIEGLEIGLVISFRGKAEPPEEGCEVGGCHTLALVPRSASFVFRRGESGCIHAQILFRDLLNGFFEGLVSLPVGSFLCLRKILRDSRQGGKKDTAEDGEESHEEGGIYGIGEGLVM